MGCTNIRYFIWVTWVGGIRFGMVAPTDTETPAHKRTSYDDLTMPMPMEALGLLKKKIKFLKIFY